MARLVRGEGLGRAFGHHEATPDAAFRPEVDHPVGALDDVQVVLDDEDGVAFVDELVEGDEQLADVLEVEAGGGFVEDVYAG